MHTQIQDSMFQARAILGAWQQHDAERLNQELGQAKQLGFDCQDQAEAERIELLSAIASELQQSGNPLESADSGIFCKLLRHLAFPAKQELVPNRPRLVKRAGSGDGGNSSTVKLRLLLKSVISAMLKAPSN